MGGYRYKFNESYFEIIDSSEKAYWLGFLYADGTVSDKKKTGLVKLALAEIDGYILERFKIDIDSNHPIRIYKRENRPNEQATFEIVFNSNKLIEDLRRLGIYPRKSLTLVFPKVEQVPDALIHHFIRGYFDGDGCITFQNARLMKNPCIQICGTKEFLESMRVCLKYHGMKIETILDKRHKDRVTNSFSFRTNSPREIERFYNFIYKDATRFLARKKDKFDDYFRSKGKSELILQC